MRIWKWQIEVTDRQTVMMPKGAKLLDVQMQGGDCCVWALCDQNAKKEPRSLAIYGTGHTIPNEAGEYVATVQMLDGARVFHVFDVANTQEA
jgi:hypothetical protein